VTFDGRILVVSGLLVAVNLALCLIERDLARAHQALQLHFQPVFVFRAAITLPWLKHEVIQAAGMAAKAQRNDVVELVLGHVALVDARLTQELSLDTVGV